MRSALTESQLSEAVCKMTIALIRPIQLPAIKTSHRWVIKRTVISENCSRMLYSWQTLSQRASSSIRSTF